MSAGKTALHREVLESAQARVLERVTAHPEMKEFFLAGGTGLALQEGHRRSVDLDFFRESPEVVIPRMMDFKRDLLTGRGKGGIRTEEKGTLHAEIGGTHFSLLATPYHLARRLVRAGNLALAHPVDIGLMKLAAIVQRGSKRDFIDLACILDRHIVLEDLLKLAEKKYPQARDFTVQALQALVYFDDAEKEREPIMLDPHYAWKKVKPFIEEKTRKVLPSFGFRGRK